MLRRPIETMEHVVKGVEDLADHFKIPCPRVDIGTGRTSRAFYNQQRMLISPKDWHGLEVAMVHEFTHLLAFKQGFARGHGASFFQVLLKVVVAWYGMGNVMQYPWHEEYLTICQMAIKYKLTDRPWHRYEKRDRWPQVTIGARYEWQSNSGNRAEGIVLSAYPRCRAKLQTDQGQVWFVPPDRLEEVR